MFHAGVRLPDFLLTSGVAGSIDQEYFNDHISIIR